jgi:hypothetical protein
MRRSLTFAAATTLAVLAVGPARAQPDEEPRASGLMRSQFGEVAFNIKKFLTGRNEDTVSIGAFTGPSQMPSSAGPGLARVLTEELEHAGIRVKLRAKIGLSGTYRPDEVQVTDPPTAAKFQTLRAVVKTRVEDESGKVLVEFEKTSYDNAEVATLLGLTYHRPPNALDREGRDNPKAEAEALIQSLKNPKVAVAGSVVRSAADSPYGIEVLIKGPGGQYQPRAATVEEGLAFVPIKRGEVYAIRITNRTRFQAACELSIDGLSTFAFSSIRKARRWIVKPNEQVLVQGWHISSREANEFLITEYAKTAVAELGANPASIGTITAKFTACWDYNDAPPPGEPKQFSPGGITVGSSDTSSGNKLGSLPPDGTARGEKVQVQSQYVEREFGVMRSVVSIRYSK